MDAIITSSKSSFESKRADSYRDTPDSPNDGDNNDPRTGPYVQKVIENPQTSIVQNDISGNVVKMLIVSQGKDLLITFDIPDAPCTVQDLLEEAKFLLDKTTRVWLISGCALGINYYVKSNVQGLPARTRSGGQIIIFHSSLENLELAEASNDGNASAKPKKEQHPRTITRPYIRESECLTLLSKEDETSEKLITTDSSTSNVTSLSDCGLNSSDLKNAIIGEQLVIENNSANKTSDHDSNIKGQRGRNQQALENGSAQKLQTCFFCDNIFIGSHMYTPQEPVIISQQGITFVVPVLKDDISFVNFEIKLNEVRKVWIHFGKAMPVLFVYTSAPFAAKMRELLGIRYPKRAFYDRLANDYTQRRVTLLPEVLSAESKTILESLLIPDNLLVEMSLQVANKILISALPEDVLENDDSDVSIGSDVSSLASSVSSLAGSVKSIKRLSEDSDDSDNASTAVNKGIEQRNNSSMGAQEKMEGTRLEAMVSRYKRKRKEKREKSEMKKKMGRFLNQ